MKKWITLALCLLIAGFLAVNGTFAMPDIETVFSSLEDVVGSFIARLNPEPQRDTAQFQVMLVSQVRGENGLTETQELPQLIPMFTSGTQSIETYSDRGYAYQLWSGAGVVDRFTAVRNLSQIGEENPNNAYFRIAVAVQEEAADLLYLNFNGNQQDFEWSEWKNIKIGGKAYRMTVGTYLHALSAGAVSPAALLQAALDKSATSEQIAAFRSDFLQIRVMAIDADDFVMEDNGVKTQMSAREALGYAVPLTDTFNPFN